MVDMRQSQLGHTPSSQGIWSLDRDLKLGPPEIYREQHTHSTGTLLAGLLL